mgnify:FL=1
MINTLFIFIKRNIKLFFKDKGLFFVSLITPIILLILFVTFLANVYEDSFRSAINAISPDLVVSDRVYRGLVGGQLVSSLLSVCCITVAFCSNMVMVQDKATGTEKDFLVSPVKPSVLALGYYVATFINTLIVALTAVLCCLAYLAVNGWFLTGADVMLLFLDVVTLVFFGTALSSVINIFLSTQAQISAVSSVISSMYGFICGAYMPMSQFPEWLSSLLLFLPGTYGTVLLRRHCLSGALSALEQSGASAAVTDSLKDIADLNVAFPGGTQPVTEAAVYVLFAAIIAVLVIAYILLTKYVKNKK